jgi:hypothetical protein
MTGINLVFAAALTAVLGTQPLATSVAELG